MNMMGPMLSFLGGQQALGQLGGARDDAVKRFDKNYYDPATKAFDPAFSAYADSFGLGGQAGNDRARAAFQAGPGYQFAMDQGLQALDRNAASRGMLASGNNTIDTMKFAQGLANQEFDKYRAGLGDLSRLGMSAAGGQTGRQQSLANIDMNYGNQAANTTQNMFKSMSDMFGRQQEGGGFPLGGALLGGINLAGNLLSAPYGGGGGTLASSLLGQVFGRGGQNAT